MTEDGQLETGLVRIDSSKRILNHQIAKPSPILQIFAVKYPATPLNGGGYDKRVIPRKLASVMQSQGVEKQPRRRRDCHHREQHTTQELLKVSLSNSGLEFTYSNVHELLNNLVTDDAKLAGRAICNQFARPSSF